MRLENTVINRIDNYRPTLCNMEIVQVSVINDFAYSIVWLGCAKTDRNTLGFDTFEPSNNVRVRIWRIIADFFTDNNAVNIKDNAFDHMLTIAFGRDGKS